MSQLVETCPRCGAKNISFEVSAVNFTSTSYGWRQHFEVFGVCSGCNGSTVFAIHERNPDAFHNAEKAGGFLKLKNSINNYFEVEGYISQKHRVIARPPEHTPQNIQAAFSEGATCLAVECWNASAAMFRLCVDFATTDLLPKEETAGLNSKTRRELGLRLEWLFAQGKLPKELRELSTCIKDDGNDGVHRGTLEKADALDLQDFTVALLERLYTEPERLRLAQVRRGERRKPRISGA